MEQLLSQGIFGGLKCIESDNLNRNIHAICLDKENKKTVIINIKTQNDHEYQLLLKLKGQHFRNVRVINEVCSLKEGLLIQTEYLNGYVLTTLMKELSQTQITDVINQICYGISELHSQGIIHGSISSDHIYFHISPDDRIVYKLIETTLSIGQFLDKYKILALNMQKEEDSNLLLQEGLTTATDIWALGVLIYQLFNQHELSNQQKVHQFSKNVNLTKAMLKNIPLKYQSILEGCLVNDPTTRIDIQSILKILNYDQSDQLPLSDGILTDEGRKKYHQALTGFKSIYNTTNKANQEIEQMCKRMARICTKNIDKEERDKLIQTELESVIKPKMSKILPLI